MAKSQRVKPKRKPKIEIFSRKQKLPPWLTPPHPWAQLAGLSLSLPGTGRAGQAAGAGRHAAGAAWPGLCGAGALPVTLPCPSPAFKAGGATGAPITPPFPKACGTYSGLGKSHLLPVLRGKRCQPWCGDVPESGSLHPLVWEQLLIPVLWDGRDKEQDTEVFCSPGAAE